MDWWEAVSNIGFPIVLTFYLLFRFEIKLDKLTDAINALKGAVNRET